MGDDQGNKQAVAKRLYNIRLLVVCATPSAFLAAGFGLGRFIDRERDTRVGDNFAAAGMILAGLSVWWLLFRWQQRCPACGGRGIRIHVKDGEYRAICMCCRYDESTGKRAGGD